MSGKARLTDLATKLRQTEKAQKRLSEKRKSPPPVNAPHGEKGDYVKVSVTLTPELFAAVNAERGRRKVAKERDSQVSAIIREALAAFLRGQ